MTQYKPLTIEEHVALGNALKAAWKAKGEIRCKFPKSSKPSRTAYRMENVLITLKSVLDDEVCRLVPREHDPRHLATKVYYGYPFVPEDIARPGDAFTGWRVDTPTLREVIESSNHEEIT